MFLLILITIKQFTDGGDGHWRSSDMVIGDWPVDVAGGWSAEVVAKGWPVAVVGDGSWSFSYKLGKNYSKFIFLKIWLSVRTKPTYFILFFQNPFFVVVKHMICFPSKWLVFLIQSLGKYSKLALNYYSS